MRFKRPIPSYVWCDFHGEIHESADVYQENDETQCGGLNWRKVYVESNDKEETFE